MSQPAGSPFTPEIVAAVSAHMNDDHGEDSVIICRGLAGQPDAVAARCSGLDPAGVRFAVTNGTGAEVPVVVAWGSVPTTRAEIRQEIVRMVEAARDALGLDPLVPHE